MLDKILVATIKIAMVFLIVISMVLFGTYSYQEIILEQKVDEML